MKFATISTLRHTSQPALVVEDRVHTLPFPDMYAVMEVGAEKAAKKASKEWLSVDEVKFLSPLKPFTLRDGYACEQHVLTANKNRGREVPQEWYEFPVFYFTNPNAAVGAVGRWVSWECGVGDGCESPVMVMPAVTGSNGPVGGNGWLTA